MADKSGLLGQGGGFGSGTVNNIGGAVADLFSADAYRTRAAGNRIQSQEYDLAASLARQNEQFSKTSTDIKEFQSQRSTEMVLGQQRADVAASGFGMSGSALDLMRDSAQQGALAHAVIGQQGAMEQASYETEAKSYDLMSKSALMAASADDKAATGAVWSSVLKGAAAVASLL